MVRNLILRFPVFRALLPRASRPILPLASRLASTQSLLTKPRADSQSRLFHHFPARLTSSPPPSPGGTGTGAGGGGSELPPNPSLSQRLKHLIKSYGWYALGVYIILSTLDFTVAFAAVNIIGADHVARVAASVKESCAGLLHSKPPEPGRDQMDSVSAHTSSGGHEGLYAMLVLAYTVHKTLFLPIRVGLTAAVTPRLVGWLRSRGWAGGAGTRRAAQEVRDKIRDRRGKA